MNSHLQLDSNGVAVDQDLIQEIIDVIEIQIRYRRECGSINKNGVLNSIMIGKLNAVKMLFESAKDDAIPLVDSAPFTREQAIQVARHLKLSEPDFHKFRPMPVGDGSWKIRTYVSEIFCFEAKSMHEYHVACNAVFTEDLR